MKVTAYSINPEEKEYLTRANNKQHDITLISNILNIDTVFDAKGKDGVLVSRGDDLSEHILVDLKSMGIKYVGTRSSSMDNINLKVAGMLGIEVINIPSCSPDTKDLFEIVAKQTILNLNQYQKKGGIS